MKIILLTTDLLPRYQTIVLLTIDAQPAGMYSHAQSSVVHGDVVDFWVILISEENIVSPYPDGAIFSISHIVASHTLTQRSFVLVRLFLKRDGRQRDLIGGDYRIVVPRRSRRRTYGKVVGTTEGNHRIGLTGHRCQQGVVILRSSEEKEADSRTCV